MPLIEVIFHFWFHSLTDSTPIDKKALPAKLWFNGGRAFDEEIRQKFLETYEKARAGGYNEWEKTAQGRLALILVFDQFSRGMFRGTPEAFATDPQALELTQRSIQEGKDKELLFIERVFLYMPLMHSELSTVQEECVWCFEELVNESKAKGSPNISYFEYNLNYARQHRDIIARFGRFPHRNAILKRVATPEEIKFLAKPGSSF